MTAQSRTPAKPPRKFQKKSVVKRLRAVQRRYYRPSELALEFGVSNDSIWSWVRQGILPSVKIGRAILLPKDRVDQIIQERTREVGRP